MDKKELELKLKQELIRACEEAKRNKVKPTLFLAMLYELGPVEASIRVVAKEKTASGFTDLLLIGRPDLSVEHIISQPEYRDLFDEVTLRFARERLGIG